MMGIGFMSRYVLTRGSRREVGRGPFGSGWLRDDGLPGRQYGPRAILATARISAMARLFPVVLLTIFAGYVIWADATSVEPLSPLTWVIDGLIVGLATWSWISFMNRKREEPS